MVQKHRARTDGAEVVEKCIAGVVPRQYMWLPSLPASRRAFQRIAVNLYPCSGSSGRIVDIFSYPLPLVGGIAVKLFVALPGRAGGSYLLLRARTRAARCGLLLIARNDAGRWGPDRPRWLVIRVLFFYWIYTPLENINK